MTNGEEWPATWNQAIGRRIAEIRREVGLSAQALADSCTDLGHPMQRGTIAKFENGRRETVGVHELVVIATALYVAPAELLFPGAIDGPQDDPDAGEPTVEYLPGRPMPSSAAWKNFHGRTSPGSVRLVQAQRHVRSASDLLDQLVQEQREDEKRQRRDG